MKKLLFSALAGLVLVTACKKDNDPAQPATMQLSGSLSGNNEVPAITTSGTGTLTGTYDPTSKVLNYTVTFSGLSANASSGHLHYGDAKHLGPVVIPFTGVPVATSGTVSGSATLTSMQADSLTAGRMYVNIHSLNHRADGEIRATVVTK